MKTVRRGVSFPVYFNEHTINSLNNIWIQLRAPAQNYRLFPHEMEVGLLATLLERPTIYESLPQSFVRALAV
jgi:hypothetical protein